MKNKDFIQETADKIITALENGTAPWIKPWKAIDLQNTLPYNPTTGKEYNGINSINLMLQGYSDPRWLTYNQAKSLNAQVKKGEKSTLIQYWQFSEKVDKLDEMGKPITNENGEIEKIEIPLETPKVFFANVFNAEQIENMSKLDIKPQIDEFKTIEAAENIIKNSGAKIVHKGNNAYYQPNSDTITLPPKESFISESAYYATALHELGHWSGHESRLNRDLNHPFGSDGYAKEELRAEISSFLNSGKLGLDYDPKQHLAYIDSWVKILKDKPTEIFRA
ncbi:ArdC family protein, partial [Campylobacter fetus]